MLEKWIEPPLSLNQNLSTLLHQILSVIVEYSGVSFKKLMATLGGPGPFSEISEQTVKALLNEMANTEPPLIEQAGDQTLMLGKLGEQIAERYEFFAVFKTTEEFRIVTKGKTLGTVSIANAFGPDDYIVFAGQRWKVIEVDDKGKVVDVESAPAGRAPVFEGGDPAPLSDRLVEEIKAVYLSSEFPAFLDAVAMKPFIEGQSAFRTAMLANNQMVTSDSSIYLFPWRGTAVVDAMRLALRREGVAAEQTEISLRIHRERATDAKAALTRLAVPNYVTGEQLAELDENLERSKFDGLISRKLLRKAAAVDRINAAGVPVVAAELLEKWVH
jgi:ATP-dependent Lhr-like helicase